MNRRLRVRSMLRILCLHRVFGVAICLGAILLSGSAYAQDALTVSGMVTDETTGGPLPGVNIAVQGTTIGTSTDAEGRYELQVPGASDTLLYSFIGYERQVIPVQGRTTINVVMSPSVISGEQLVVVGYSAQAKKDLTGSVAVVNLDAMTTQPSAQVAKQLQGQASGVTVISSGQPGETPSVRIRGINTFGNNEPLYVIDGVPTQNIKSLNSNNIASMQVLKDAAAASIYGSRASNGVIIITTKKGRGDVTINYDAYYGMQVPQSGNVWDIASPQEMARITWTATQNGGGSVSDLDQYYDPANPDQPRLPDYISPTGAMEGDASVNPENYFVDPTYTDPGAPSGFYQIIPANKEGTNWFDEVFDPAAMMNHNLSVSGGGDQGNYLFSFNYMDRQGTLMETFYKRYTLRANTSFNVDENIRIGENLSYSVSENPQVASLTEGSAIGMALRAHPVIPVYDIMGNFAGTQAAGMGNGQNPVANQYRTRNNEANNNRLFGNIFAEIDLLDNVMLRTSFGGEIYAGASHSFQYPSYERAENSTFNQFNADAYYGYNYTWTNTLTYVETFNEVHNVNVVVGTEAYKNKGQELGGSTQSYFSFDPDFTNLDTGSGIQTNTSFQYEDALLSYFGRVDYSYDNRYLVSATLRRDGSSRFLNHQWGWFPAASIGWRITNEEFFPEVSWLTDLKIRAGYGVMGNQLNVDPNNSYTLFSNNPVSSYYAIDGSNESNSLGFEQGRIGNPDAKWEKDINSNIGIDAILFNGRVELIVDYYQKDIIDLLYDPELIATAGASAAPPAVNVGNMKNTGIDASITTFGNISDDLQYNVNVSFTSYNNEIVKIAQGVEYFGQESRRYNGINIIRNAVGHPVSAFYGYNIIGFWDSQDEIDEANAGVSDGIYQEGIGIGRFRYEDITGDGEITPEDRTFLGNPNPDFTYGISLGFNYNAFDLSMFWYGSQGNEIWNQVKWWHDFYSGFVGAKSKTALYDSWTPENRNAEVSILETTQTFSNNQVPNSYMVEDGSYLRLKNVQIGYTLPPDLLQKIGVSNLRVYVQAANLLTLTSYSGLDPEVGFFPGDNGGGPTNFGIDEGSYPNQRQFLIGINLSY